VEFEASVVYDADVWNRSQLDSETSASAEMRCLGSGHHLGISDRTSKASNVDWWPGNIQSTILYVCFSGARLPRNGDVWYSAQCNAAGDVRIQTREALEEAGKHGTIQL